MSTEHDAALELIRKAKAEMEASRAKEQAERERVDAERAKEAERLAIAEQVFAELAKKAAKVAAPMPLATTWPAATPAPATPAAPAPAKKIPAAGGTSRPTGIPTVPQMVTLLLERAEKDGKRGLTSTEIMAGIDSAWWPGVSVNLIMPTIYRCISKGYWFEKQGNLFMRMRGGQPTKRGMDELKLDS